MKANVGDGPVLADGSEGGFGLERDTQFVYRQHVQRRVQRLRDLGGDRHTPRGRPGTATFSARSRDARYPANRRPASARSMNDTIAPPSADTASRRSVQGAARVVLAVPVAPRSRTRRLGEAADEFVRLETPRELFAAGQFYEDFAATADAQVRDRLGRAQESAGSGSAQLPRHSAAKAVDPEVVLPVLGGKLAAQLVTPSEPGGIVIFAHGSGSSRRSPRNRYVAEALNSVGLATLLLDLLTEDEERDRANVFDVELLAGRLQAATEWAGEWLDGLPVGYFGASTGAAAALCAAADPDCPARAVVTRGGRPDLAAAYLPSVTAPTLLIVGGRDEAVVDLNRQAQAMLRCENSMEIVPGATHLFAERGALERVAELAADWFTAKLRGAPGSGPRAHDAERSRSATSIRRGPGTSPTSSRRRASHG